MTNVWSKLRCVDEGAGWGMYCRCAGCVCLTGQDSLYWVSSVELQWINSFHTQWRICDFSEEGAMCRRRSGGGVWYSGSAGPPPQNKISFCPQSDIWVHFAAVFIRKKHWQSLEAFGHGFYGSITNFLNFWSAKFDWNCDLLRFGDVICDLRTTDAQCHSFVWNVASVLKNTSSSSSSSVFV